MASEIERKFLVNREAWPTPPDSGVLYRQGYLSVDPERTVRVRIAGEDAFLTVKGLTRGIERLEFEYLIPVADAAVMLASRTYVQVADELLADVRVPAALALFPRVGRDFVLLASRLPRLLFFTEPGHLSKCDRTACVEQVFDASVAP